MTIEILGYIVATLLAFSGTTGARLQKSGELSRFSKSKPLIALVMTLVYGFAGFTAVFYFSWAILNWFQIGSFFLVHITIASSIANSGNRKIVWVLFFTSVILTAASEIYILKVVHF